MSALSRILVIEVQHNYLLFYCDEVSHYLIFSIIEIHGDAVLCLLTVGMPFSMHSE